MIYLTPTTREHGSLRVLPASHTYDYQAQLKRLQGHHGVHTYHPAWAAGTFGTSGAELPSTAIEAVVGDVLCFHHSLYHAVRPHLPLTLRLPSSLLRKPGLVILLACFCLMS